MSPVGLIVDGVAVRIVGVLAENETSPEGSTNRIMRLFGMSDQTR